MNLTLTVGDLQREMAELGDRYPRLADDELFVLWFLRAFVTADEKAAASALCGGAGDKSVDGVVLDEAAKTAFIVQGKYRKDVNAKQESRPDVLAFAQLAADIASADEGRLQALGKDMAPDVLDRIKSVRERVRERGYYLQLYYVTLGRIGEALAREAKAIVRGADASASLDAIDGSRVLRLLTDYLDGVAPPVPSLELPIDGPSGSVLQRYDRKTNIESWIFSMTDADVADLYKKAGLRLFARNVRGYLGTSSVVNRGIEDTLSEEPERFWYYNNGITVICDDASRESGRGTDVLRVTNPQVINGQQTTRTLSENSTGRPRASVLVRVIRVPRKKGEDGADHFETLVSKIVSATNSQNAVRPSDLMSNDRRQIEIERRLRNLGYWYIRKRQTKREVRRTGAGREYVLVKKEELAQAVAACEFDPSLLREGKERLFEERWYEHVFPNSDPFYYLPRFLLMREVAGAVRHHDNSSYAKWLVLNFVWDQLAPLVRSRRGEEAFRYEWHRPDAALPALRGAIDAAFVAAGRFYRANRGSGADALDWAGFSQRRGLHKQFAEFWRSRQNKSRKAFDRRWARFERHLKEPLS